MHEQYRYIRRTASIAVAAFLCGGCATSHRFQVDAVRNPALAREQASYRLVNANPDLTDADPQVARVAGLVRTALSSKGLYEAPPGLAADLQVEVDFGIEGPKRVVEERTEMVYMEASDLRGPVVPAESAEQNVLSRNPGAPREFMAEAVYYVVVSVYDKYLRITARESVGPTANQPPREVWSVYVGNRDKSTDLEERLTLLVAAAMDALDTDTAGAQPVELAPNDARVIFIAQGM